jgi:luciferase family oxidoreductase group 1
MRLGVVDTQRPAWMPKLVSHLDRLGYSRYWATEQRSSVQSASPTLVAAIAGSHSQRLRVGTAGVLLGLYSPLKVAEDFRLLQIFLTGRLDLGIAGAIPTEPLLSALLDGRPPPQPDTYARKVRALVRLVRGEPAEAGGISGTAVGPRGDGTPEIWLCGTTPRSAALAAELGISYSFHHFLAGTHPAPSGAPRPDGPEIVRMYVDAFRPHPSVPEPRYNVACYGVCADTSERASHLWNSALPQEAQRSDLARMIRPTFCGNPVECRDQLLALRQQYGTEEVIVQSITLDFEAYLASYTLLAHACNLG